MRKAQKAQLLEILQTLEEAHKAIKNYAGRRELEAARALLSECQESAVQVGSIIEESEGEDCPAVGLLEAYCEALYQASIGIPEEITAQRAYKMLNKALFQVEHSVRDEIPVRLEVVFLPYKASMWDSFKSVWKAAMADPRCDAFVIPIPYYDKNPDGSLRDMHYEGSQYPKDVPAVWYKDYDFDGRRPDIIFIHNPYDEYNHVTSVEPFFYAKNLKQYTEKLVYIPYFVLGEVDPGSPAALEGILHFCMIPGVLHADNVIVQSENMRRAYINVLAKKLGEHTRPLWTSKILGLGSPKFDEVLNTEYEDLEIPGEWLKIILKPDGTRKKIILYNTSIGALLRHNGSMLDKIQDVLRIFKENRDEVALLWRPHPLIQATIESMRPALWRDYLQIVNQFQSEAWGIYDSSPDLNRAVALSDAYYGDSSSVVQLCEFAGMPVLIQNVETLAGRCKKALTPCAWAVAGHDIYFSERFLNGLFKINCDTLETTYIGSCLTNIQDKRYLHASVLQMGNRLFFTPYNSDGIDTYDLETAEIEHISLPQRWMGSTEKFFCSACWGDRLFLFGGLSWNITVFETKRGNFFDLTECAKSVQPYISEPDSRGFYFYGAAVIGDEIYAVSGRGDFILKINARHYAYEIIPLHSPNIGYVRVLVVEEDLWLIPITGTSFVKYDIRHGKCTIIDVKYNNLRYSCGIVAGTTIFALPEQGDFPLQIDTRTGEPSVVEELAAVFCGSGTCLENSCLLGSWIVCFSVSRQEMILFNLISREVRTKRLDAEYSALISKCLYLNESQSVRLPDWMNAAAPEGHVQKPQIPSGTRIYQKIFAGI